MAELIITKENFDEEVRNYRGEPILLDFWAGWCGPCSMLSPIIAEIAEEYEGKLRVGKVNVDEQPELAAAFRVESIPLLVLVKDGAIHKQEVGYRDKDSIIEKAMQEQKVQDAIQGKTVRKTIVVPGKLVNIVAG